MVDGELREQVASIILEAQIGGCTRYEAADRIIFLMEEVLAQSLEDAACDALDELIDEL